MKNFFITFLALFLGTPGVVEARSIETVGMCQLKVKSRYAREMEEISKEPNDEMVKVLTQDALVRREEGLEKCLAKRAAPKTKHLHQKKEKRVLNQDREEDWSCATDIECQNGKIEAMGMGAE